MIDFLPDNEVSIASSMRLRHPSQLITYLEISNPPPPCTSPALDTYAVLVHILCRAEHQTYFSSIKSIPSVPLPWFHHRWFHRHFVLATKLQPRYFTNFRPSHLLLREISPPLNTNSSTRKNLSNPSMSLHPPNSYIHRWLLP